MKRRHAALAAVGLVAGCAHRHPQPRVEVTSVGPFADDRGPVTVAPTSTSSTTTAPVVTVVTAAATAEIPHAPGPAVHGSLLSVTAYCQSGTMADGRQTRAGAAAGNRWPFGTRLYVAGYGTVTIEDRIGSGSDLDIFMPSCAQAISWGRRELEVSAT